MATSDDTLIREIDEDLRRERWAKLWKRYGAVVIGGAAAIVLAVAGYQGWHGYRQTKREAVGQRFAAAEVEAARDPKAVDAFAAIAADGTPGYALLARLQEAKGRAAAGDGAAAAHLYGEITASEKDAIYRDLSVLMGVASILSHSGEVIADTQALRARLEPLAAADNPWRFSAQELMAMLALDAGDTVGAKGILEQLRKDAAAPADLRTRADQLFEQLDKG